MDAGSDAGTANSSNNTINGSRNDIPYEIRTDECIGSGGFGTVYKAYGPGGEVIAAKVIPLAENKSSDRILREVRTMKNLDHPNIVRYLCADLGDTEIRIFMEYVQGGTLDCLITRQGHISAPVISDYTYGILSGLNYLSYSGIMHRDVKSKNILVDGGRVAKLADFGLAKFVQDCSKAKSGFCGTPQFMAPEAISGNATKTSDIWSVGCVVVHMMTGKIPFNEYEDVVTVLFQVGCRKAKPKIPDDCCELQRSFLNLCFASVDIRPSAEDMLHHPYIRSKSSTSKIPSSPAVSTSLHSSSASSSSNADSSTSTTSSTTVAEMVNTTTTKTTTTTTTTITTTTTTSAALPSSAATTSPVDTIDSTLTSIPHDQLHNRQQQQQCTTTSTSLFTVPPSPGRLTMDEDILRRQESGAISRISSGDSHLSKRDNSHVAVLVAAPVIFEMTNDTDERVLSFGAGVDECGVGGISPASDLDIMELKPPQINTEFTEEATEVSKIMKHTNFAVSFFNEVATPESFAWVLSRKCSILHITGQNSDEGLTLEDNFGGITIASCESVQKASKGYNGSIQVAVVMGENPCEATRILQQIGIPRCIAVTLESPSIKNNEQATVFVRSFYEALFADCTVDSAFNAGASAAELCNQNDSPQATFELFVAPSIECNVGLLEPLSEGDAVDVSRPFPPSVLPGAQPHFVGREKEMHAVVARVRHFQVTTITGCGGIGKSRLAVQVGYFIHYRRIFADGVYFIDHNGLDVAALPFSIAKALNRDVETKNEMLAALASKSALLIIDRCEQLTEKATTEFQDLITLILSKAPHVHLLLTSRKPVVLDTAISTVAIGALPLYEAVGLINKMAPRKVKTTDALSLAKICGCLPLALRVVGRVLGNDHRGLVNAEQLIHRLAAEKERLKALKSMASSQKGENVEACIRSSYDMLTSQLQEQFRALSIFPGSFDLAAAATVLPNESEWDLRESLFQLVECSLVEFDARSSRFYLHELVRVFGSNEAELPENTAARDDQRKLLVVHVCQLLRDATKRYKEHSSLDVFDRDRHNIDLAMRIAGSPAMKLPPELHAQLLVAGRLLFRVRMDPHERCRIFTSCLGSLRTVEEHNLMDESMLLCEIGFCSLDKNEIKTAIQQYKEAIALQNKGNIEDCIENLELWNLYGTALEFDRDFESSEKVLQKCLQKSKDLLGEDHPQTAQIMNNLANLYLWGHHHHQALDQAETLHRAVLKCREQVLGQHHVEVAQSMHNLATLLSMKCQRLQGQAKEDAIKESEDFFLKTLEIRRRVLGHAHPSVAATLNGLGNLCLKHKKDYRRAEELLREGLGLRQQFYGKFNSKVAESQTNLAALLVETESFSEAEEMLRSSLQVYGSIPEKPSVKEVAKLEFELAHVVYAQGREEEASQLYKGYTDFKKKQHLRPLPQEFAFRQIINLSSTVPGIRYHLLGEGGKNLKSIEERTLCNIRLMQQANEISLEITGRSEKAVNAGMEDCKQLVTEVTNNQQQQRQYQQQRNRPPYNKQQSQQQSQPYNNRRVDAGYRPPRNVMHLADFVQDERFANTTSTTNNNNSNNSNSNNINSNRVTNNNRPIATRNRPSSQQQQQPQQPQQPQSQQQQHRHHGSTPRSTSSTISNEDFSLSNETLWPSLADQKR